MSNYLQTDLSRIPEKSVFIEDNALSKNIMNSNRDMYKKIKEAIEKRNNGLKKSKSPRAKSQQILVRSQ